MLNQLLLLALRTKFKLQKVECIQIQSNMVACCHRAEWLQ